MLNVNTNFPAMTGLRTLGMSQTKLNTSIERLSTGLRINRASDDPSGLVISEKLRSQINGLNMALTNTQNDINLVNTAEAALQEISDILTSMRSSVIFAMNTGFSIPEQIDAEQDKIDQSLVAIDRIAQSTRFSRRKLLDGSSSFVVEQNTADRAALDDLYVRQVRLAPSADRQTFSVNLTKLAERATLITNIDYRSSVGLASANPAGSGGTNQFVTLRVSGARGAEDVNFGIGSTVQDVISAINQNATSTGVYASAFKALPISSTFNDIVIAGSSGGLNIRDAENSVTFGVRINGGPVQNVTIVDGNAGTGTSDGIIADGDLVTPGTENELLTQLQAIDANFLVDLDAGGNIRISNNGASFELVAAENVRTFTVSAADLAKISDADADGNAELDVTIDGIGTALASITVAVSAMGANFNPASQTDRQNLLAALNNIPLSADDSLSAMFDTENNLIFVDTANNLQTAGAGNIGLAMTPAQDTAVGAALSGQPVLDGNFTAGLDVASLSVNGTESTNRPVEFVNIAIDDIHIDGSGNLAIDTSGMATPGTFEFEILDPETGNLVNFDVVGTGAMVNGQNVVTLADLNGTVTGLQTAGQFNTPSAWQAFFSAERGLTIVYNNNQAEDPAVMQATDGRFLIQDDSASTTTDITVLTGKTAYSSNTNNELLALYSLDFGSDKVIKLEDVTSATSSLTMKSSANGGIRVTENRRNGLGVLDDTSPAFRDLRGGTFAANGVDLAGTVNGLEFGASGVNVQMVTASLDLKFTASEGWGMFGSLGLQADAAAFGLATTIGGTILQPSIAGEPLPDGVMDSFEFSIRQNFEGGPRGRNGLRFQIRESGGVQDSLTIGVRGVGTGDLGIDLSPESEDPTTIPRLLGQRGGLLNTLRSGAGNDLFQNPENALVVLDQAIDQVSDLRAFLGSISSDTLQRNLNSVSVAVQNLTEAEATIRDINFAQQTTELARQQVLFQAGISVLGQANQQPGQLLSLLR